MGNEARYLPGMSSENRTAVAVEDRAQLPVGTRVLVRHTGAFGTVVPTGRQVPRDEVNVMADVTGSVTTFRLRALDRI
jgi:hypothetical protein